MSTTTFASRWIACERTVKAGFAHRVMAVQILDEVSASRSSRAALAKALVLRNGC
jgi:hypothetical protein